MLVVDPDPIESEDQVTQEALNPADYVWPHGLTPPLRHVRERRWRPHRMGDPIKAEVDRLLAKDKECKSYSFGESKKRMI
jgi:transcription initiation factor TFIID subunit 7